MFGVDEKAMRDRLAKYVLEQQENARALFKEQPRAPLSDKAKEVQVIVRAKNWGCADSNVADLVSAILGERITLKDEKPRLWPTAFHALRMSDNSDHTGSIVVFYTNYKEGIQWNSKNDKFEKEKFECWKKNWEPASDKEIRKFCDEIPLTMLIEYFGGKL